MDGSWTGSIGRLPRDVLFFLNNIEKLILERTSSPPHFSFSTATLEPCKPAPCLPLSQGCGKGSLSTSTGLNSPESPSTSAETSTAGPLLGAPGLTTRSKDATNGAPGLTTRSKAALNGATGLTTRSKDATNGVPGLTISSKDATRGSWPYY